MGVLAPGIGERLRPIPSDARSVIAGLTSWGQLSYSHFSQLDGSGCRWFFTGETTATE
jgi:hypothetical protein